MGRPIRLGQSDFRRIREDGDYYVDKSTLISDVLQASNPVLLLPRPRRFGKTLNQSMLHAFFDDTQQSRLLFEDLAIGRDEAAMAQVNAYPTLFLTLKDMDKHDWASCQEALKLEISALIARHRERVWEVADIAERAMIDDLHLQRASLTVCERSLRLLTALLHKVSGRRVIVLLDEYDNPIHVANAHGFQAELLSFLRNFMGAALKDNPHLERAVITGILRIGKESIYSGLNSLTVYTILDKPFSAAFGFTEREVEQVLCDCGLSDKLEQIQHWYNGYRFGDTTIYNPWSILNTACAPNEPFKTHWINTSNNQLINDLIVAGKGSYLEDLQSLLAGQSILKELKVTVTLRDQDSESLWSLLFFSGYLTAHEYNPTTGLAKLTLPNHEIRSFFQRMTLQWLGPPQRTLRLVDDLLSGRLEAFKNELGAVIESILSYYDTSGKHPERIYHVFMIGLLAQLKERYRLLSNREAGHGRPDLVMLPNHPGDPGFVFEFKSAETEHEMEKAAADALIQIECRRYDAVFRQEAVDRWLCLGLAFHHKRVALCWREHRLGAP